MLKNYLIVAWRNLMRNKVFSFINIFGLSLGITSCIFISLYILEEISYDKHWKNADAIIKINWEETGNGITDPYAVSAFGTGPSLKRNFPEVEEFLRIMPANNLTVSYNNKYFNENKNYFVDSTFFNVFNYELLYGDSKNCLREPNSIVISEAMAAKFFGKNNPLGLILKYPKNSYKVTGVIKETQQKSHLSPNALLRINYSDKEIIEQQEGWLWINTYTYLKLRTPLDAVAFDEKLKIWAKKTLEPVLKKENVGYKIELKSKVVSQVHFDNYHADEFEKSDKSNVYFFGLISFFILLIACFNYMNLSTAKATKRAKEVGMRKVIGALRKEIIFQFLGESFIISLISFIFSLALLVIFIPAFNALTSKNIIFLNILADFNFWAISLLIILFISFIGGSYPAFYLSNFKPIHILKGNLNLFKSPTLFRKIKFRQLLVVAQFAISIIIIIVTILIYDQLKLLKNKDLGFNKDQVLVLRMPGLDSLGNTKVSSLKNELLLSPLIKKFSTANQIIGVEGNILFRTKDKGQMGQSSLNVNSGDYEYLDLLGVKFVEGRNFSKQITGDGNNFIINEAAAKFLQLKNPLSAELGWDEQHLGKIIGVVKDFNYNSLHTKIDPLVLALRNSVGSYALIKLSSDNVKQSVDLITEKWKVFFPQNPISYFFMDEGFNKQYSRDDVMLIIFVCFAGLTILISCLGLFGLASYSTEQRTKEIGIRKIIGASVTNIIKLISIDFLFLILVAIFIASPIAYFFIKSWLQNFAYKTEISFWAFLLAGILTICTAFLTVFYIALKAAFTNPIKNLRTE